MAAILQNIPCFPCLAPSLWDLDTVIYRYHNYSAGIPAGTTNCIYFKVWDEITYPFPNFNGCRYFHITLYNVCNYFSMLGLKLIHVSKRGHWGCFQWSYIRVFNRIFNGFVTGIGAVVWFCKNQRSNIIGKNIGISMCTRFWRRHKRERRTPPTHKSMHFTECGLA